MFKRFITGFIVLSAMLAFTSSAFAATSVRLEQPKTPTNQNSFNLVFVALDTTGNPVTVTCWKEGPADGSFTQFGSSITLKDGGNTDSCPIDSSIMNTQGTYSFYVIANGVTSNTVTVEYNTNGPGTPSNYSKENASSCQYKITFTTADDGGKTSKVELYRSDNTSFNADSGTLVQSTSIGSNTNGSFTDTVPDCNKSYYYAIRSFDNAGNGSGVVGDSETHTISSTTPAPTQTSGEGAIPVVTSSVNKGDEISSTPTGTQTVPTSGVLGAATTAKATKTSGTHNFFDSYKMIILILGILAVGAFTVFLVKTRNK